MQKHDVMPTLISPAARQLYLRRLDAVLAQLQFLFSSELTQNNPRRRA